MSSRTQAVLVRPPHRYRFYARVALNEIGSVLGEPCMCREKPQLKEDQAIPLRKQKFLWLVPLAPLLRYFRTPLRMLFDVC